MRHDLQTLKAFIAIADEGSIARAAERENTVASALSKRQLLVVTRERHTLTRVASLLANHLTSAVITQGQ